MKTLEQLLVTAKKIIDLNPEALLSGSIVLKLFKINIRREPQDIDIFIPYGSPELVFPEGMKLIPVKADHYPPDGYQIDQYTLDNTKIDLIFADSPQYNILPQDTLSMSGIKLVTASRIMTFKMDHALDDECSSATKHKFDLIHILCNN